MSIVRMANPTLHLHRVHVPYSKSSGTLMLAVPRRQRPANAVRGAWEARVLDALLDLQVAADFGVV